MPRPRSLTDARIAAAALAVVDRDGLAALSMRAVAAQLGMATMAVYRYVESREQLETLLVDQVLDTGETGPAPDLPWDRQVATLLGRVRHAVAAHPYAAPLVLARWHASSGARRCAGAVLGILAQAGISGRMRGTTHHALMAYLIGAIQLDHAALERARLDRAQREQVGEPSPDVPSAELFHDGLAALLRGFGPGPASDHRSPGPA